MSEQTFIIVGASLAGAKAAEELREQGFDGRVLLIGSEPERPYERPPLTKDYLRGESEREKAYVHEQGFYEHHQIELQTDTTVTRDRLRRLARDARRRPRARLRPAAAGHGRRAAPDPDRGRRARRRPLPAHAAGLRCAARAPGDRWPGGGRRRRLDRQRVRGLGAPARPRGHDRRSARAAQRADLRPGDRRLLPRRARPSTASSCCSARASRRSRATAPSRACGPTSGRMIECDFAVVGIGVVPRVELAARRRPGGRQRHRRRREASDLGAERVRGRRRRQRAGIRSTSSGSASSTGPTR